MTVELANYEGLVFRTAQMYSPLLDDDEDDVRQVLRIKVWKALLAFDPAKATQTTEKYVFMCVRNQVKDLLKKKKRPEDFIEDKAPADSPVVRERFECDHLSATPDEIFAEVEDEGIPLPSTLDALERDVALLLYLDFNQTEIARELCVTRQRVRAAHASVKLKMADWRPSSSPERAEALQAAA